MWARIFDIMDKIFSLDSFRTKGKLIDVSHLRDREVKVTDLASVPIEEDDFVIFHTGYIEELGYFSRNYPLRSAELSDETVDYLIGRKVRMIGVDAAGAQKPKKHHKVDTRCAEHGVFIVENLTNLQKLLALSPREFTVFTAPLNRPDLTGQPCRVLAEIAD